MGELLRNPAAPRHAADVGALMSKFRQKLRGQTRNRREPIGVGRGGGAADAWHVEDDRFRALQRAQEGLRQLEVGADAVEQQERRSTLRAAFYGDSQGLRPDFDHPELEFNPVRFIV